MAKDIKDKLMTLKLYPIDVCAHTVHEKFLHIVYCVFLALYFSVFKIVASQMKI